MFVSRSEKNKIYNMKSSKLPITSVKNNGHPEGYSLIEGTFTRVKDSIKNYPAFTRVVPKV